MKLEKFHVAHRRSSPIGHRNAIPSGDRWIRSIAVNLPGAAARQQHRRSADDSVLRAAISDQNDPFNPIIRLPQIGGELELRELDIGERSSFGGKGPANLASGGIAVRMQNSRTAMR